MFSLNHQSRSAQGKMHKRKYSECCVCFRVLLPWWWMLVYSKRAKWARSCWLATWARPFALNDKNESYINAGARAQKEFWERYEDEALAWHMQGLACLPGRPLSRLKLLALAWLACSSFWWTSQKTIHLLPVIGVARVRASWRLSATQGTQEEEQGEKSFTQRSDSFLVAEATSCCSTKQSETKQNKTRAVTC